MLETVIDTPNMGRFPNLIMMYADQVIQNKRPLANVPERIREDVKLVVEDFEGKKFDE
ncbi:hypothetical protein [Enterococcus mundtii]|uniref:hypothetical protein n=1 Tax=Enterococcus mundtii TaxID=53346 RepID=UPI001A972418|nr:hypothetical protein [Enterococcus mundtii]